MNNFHRHGLTTIAAIPSVGGFGMALRGETNTRPIYYYDPWRGFSNHANISMLWIEIEREREALDLAWLRGESLTVTIVDWEGMPCNPSWRRKGARA